MSGLFRAVFAAMFVWISAAAAAVPTLNANGWTLVLVPVFEMETGTNNLSVAGLNRSLTFGQTAAMFSAGLEARIRGVQAFQPAANTSDISSLQTLEPLALLRGMPITVQSVTDGSDTTYGSARYWIHDLLANQREGIYFISAARPTVRDLVKYLTGNDVTLGAAGEYAVVSGAQGKMTVQTFDGAGGGDTTFPQVPVPTGKQCRAPTQFTASAPKGLQSYKSRTVYFVRHVEAHPTNNFENGNYVCQGQWRALGAVSVLETLLGREPDSIVSSNPSGLIGCSGSCNYIRPLLTITPFAIKKKMPVAIAPFNWTDATDLAYWLFDKASPYPNGGGDNKLTLVAWEHDHIVAAVTAVFANVYQNPAMAAKLPTWGFNDYDTVWKLTTDTEGNVTFSDTCEGIPSERLPNVCPSFFR